MSQKIESHNGDEIVSSSDKINTLKKLWKLVKPIRPKIILNSLIQSVDTVRMHVWTFADLYLARIIELYSKHGLTDDIKERMIIFTLIYPTAFLLTSVANTTSYYFMRRIEFVIGEIIEKIGFDKVLKLSHKFQTNNKPGEITTRINNAISSARSVVTRFSSDISQIILKIITAIPVLISMDYKFALVILSLLIFTLVASKLTEKKTEKIENEINESQEKLNAHVVETISNLNLVKMFANTKIEKESLDKNYASLKQAESKGWKYDFFKMFVNVDLSMATTLGLMIRIFVYSVFSNTIAISQILALTNYFFWLSWPIQRLPSLWNKTIKDLTKLKKYFDLLEEKEDIQDKENAIELQLTKPPKIEFHNVSFQYKEEPIETTESNNAKTKEVGQPKEKIHIIKHLDLQIEAGKSLAIVGPSGAGKTTLINLLCRFYDVRSGAVKINDTDIRDVTQDSLHRNIAIVSQDIGLFQNTIRYNIAYGKPNATDEEIITALKKAQAWEFIKDLQDGINTDIGQKGMKLSGGQRQRLTIARAFIMNSPILILDEATSNLDSESEKLIALALDEIRKNRTVIIIAHRLATVQKADSIIVFDQGEIIERGTHEDLARSGGLYQKIYEAQVEGLLV